jgi:hypothetical protein
VIQRLAARFGRRDGDAQVFLDAGLADEILQTFRPEAGVQRPVFGQRLAGYDAADVCLPGGNLRLL